ncbi:1,4-dihydroxy-2-naphthoate polyprenyltransferase [Rariglobus hedericola]|uniref:1,4-dihydroxy-2-naphthoate octaprenyltransferase n=1 Tax=Rariglobus hedericola TaxID=2597822 RepID=A0A556QPF2_9BACT|nr:1,4-dihydroxy-2-naphthoate polyprenyltransferase [Rariglobus hedericola]TSJ78509.1 1,4-dihydroxy-2-naphthoate polyprenyltransferase [Rariglobus hedericola]
MAAASTAPSVLSIWVGASRPRTLPAAIAPVLAASALAWRDGDFEAPASGVCLAFALLIQIGTNFANDYYDFVKGADTAERVGPRRAVASGLVAPATMKRAMIAVFAVAFATGLTLLAYGGWPLLIIGVASVVCGVAYTGGPYPLGYNGLGDIFVFIFFGLVAVGATYFVQAGVITQEAWIIGTGIGALAANILVVNNYRDVETDAKAGKRTLVVRFGRRFARAQFITGHGLALAALVAVGAGDWHPAFVITGAVVCVVAGWIQSRRLARATGPAELIRLLGQTGMYLAVYALVLSAGLIWG